MTFRFGEKLKGAVNRIGEKLSGAKQSISNFGEKHSGKIAVAGAVAAGIGAVAAGHQDQPPAPSQLEEAPRGVGTGYIQTSDIDPWKPKPKPKPAERY